MRVSPCGLYAIKATAEDHGLVVEKGAKYGYYVTTLTPESEQYIQSLGKTGFSLVRPKVNTLKGSSAKADGSSRKYVCPGCGAIIRATKEVNVTCGDCEVPFELEG